ncbi:MAG TPA: NAD(P)/FAD-dependent oxidoreductase [Pyrinomonadaceae bacterium]|nr:NAD(P)/FAD-dependent oxidoreductase [Pyrinomonadaceae bacterium]HMP66311.1 NAD(P)/FAD-dependent oxidoreductase [Pyrinomonadaceae bacterium]
MPEKIAIVGAGMLGLTLALRCSEAGHNVTLYEAAPEIGGLASVWQIGEITWDRHYHVTLFSDRFTRKIVEDLGIGDEFEWVETKTGFYTDGRLVSMSDTIEFLTFPPLDLISKVRLGFTIFYASKIKNWRKLEQIPVERWLTRLSGRRTFEKIWRPLLKAKLGEAYAESSAAFIWASIQRMYAARHSGMKKEMFGYVRGGYARLLGRFGEVLDERGVEVKLNANIRSITGNGDGAVMVEESEGRRVFDRVILTCPANVVAKLVPELEEAERSVLLGVRYQGIVCASMLLKRSISDYYVTNITDETPFTGIIEMSALVDKSEFGGLALVYLPRYIPPDDPMFEESDDAIREHFVRGLEAMYPDFDRDDIVEFKISRVRRVFPLPVLNYSEQVPDIRTSIDGVFVVNSSQITNGTLNVNETVQVAESAFARLFSAD